MLKIVGIYICLFAFLLQTSVFNLALFGGISFAKLMEGNLSETSYTITLTSNQFQNLKWLNKSEFTFGDFLMDVKNTSKENNLITLTYKIDIKEKGFLERLADHLKNKKSFTYAFAINQLDVPQFSFLLTASNFIHKTIVVSVTETSFPKDSPPPKA